MLDIKKVGLKIAALRKAAGYSQEKLAGMLHISPQAISKWENGHTLPETSLLPVLARLFGCTIDEIIMPAYNSDIKIENEPSVIEQQAEQIAIKVIDKIEKKKRNEYPGLNDDEIAQAVLKIHKIDDFTIERFGESKIERFGEARAEGRIDRRMAIKSPSMKLNIVERIYHKNASEFYGIAFMHNGKIKGIPQVYYVDYERKLLLMDDVADSHFIGDWDEDDEISDIYRKNYTAVLKTLADMHSASWGNHDYFKQIGLAWHFESVEHAMVWILDAMEKPFKKYKKNELNGKIPKVWEFEFGGKPYRFENNITKEKLEYFDKTLEYLKKAYPKYISERFNKGKNITVIHGELDPVRTLMSWSDDRNVLFRMLGELRIGLPTEDLAMFIALHISSENDNQKAEVFNDTQPLLDYYYECLTEKVKDYSYETFMDDYKLSVAENMFFTIRLINQGIFDFKMRDKAIKAFETFVLEK